jgi:predicted NBD/HSP70 family sugar kinase
MHQKMYNSGALCDGQNRHDFKMPEMRSAKSAPNTIVACAALRDTRAVAAIVDQHGRILVERQVERPPSNARATAAIIAKLILEVLAAPERRNRPVAALGVSVPGHVDPKDDRVTMAKRLGYAGWIRVDFKELIAKELPAQLPIVLCARSAAAAAAEAWRGAARGSRNVVFLRLDDQIEAGLLVDGRILRGAGGRAGAVGWLALTENFREDFATRGCFTVDGAKMALVRRVIESWIHGEASLVSRLGAENLSDLSAEMIVRAALGGDRVTLGAVVDACNWIGRGVANLISTLNPEVVVIGGELGKSLKPFLDEVRREARRWAEPSSARQCRIVSATLGAQGALLGAARLAWQHHELS